MNQELQNKLFAVCPLLYKLMGCRAISVDHELHGSCRVMPPVCSIGQAAGMAAAMCCHQNCSPAELKGEDVRKNLAQAGAWL